MKGFLFVAISLMIGGCGANGITLTQTNILSGNLKANKETLVIGNTKIPVEAQESFSGNTLTISIQDEGQELEREQYKIDASELDLIMASDDSFVPPLPLVRFPSSAGQSFAWQGTIREGAIARDATAQIAVSPATLRFTNHLQPSLCSQVRLSIASDPQPAMRTFEFWFTPNGLAKRVFGAGTTRFVEGLTQ